MAVGVDDVTAALDKATQKTYEAALQTIPVKSEQSTAQSLPKQ